MNIRQNNSTRSKAIWYRNALDNIKNLEKWSLENLFSSLNWKTQSILDL